MSLLDRLFEVKENPKEGVVSELRNSYGELAEAKMENIGGVAFGGLLMLGGPILSYLFFGAGGGLVLGMVAAGFGVMAFVQSVNRLRDQYYSAVIDYIIDRSSYLSKNGFEEFIEERGG